jgi:NAD(P)-dependent dehydrogenase (short-subunit alcohol dehydrogenase family)
MTVVVISGASRGLGLEFARQYAAEGAKVFAGARNIECAEALKVLAGGSDGRVSAHSLDVSNERSAREFARLVGEAPVDILIANAGVIGGRDQHRLETLDIDGAAEVFSINTLGVLRLGKALACNLKKAKGRFIAITSLMGSIADAGGGYYAYRMSKAALNMAMRALAGDLRGAGVVCVPMSPGWAKTDMGNPGAPQEVDATVAAMRARIAALTPADSGRFLSWDGGELPW